MSPLFARPARLLARTATTTRRTFLATPARRLADTPPAPPPPSAAPKKPVGGFRGGILGFLLGCTLTGSTLYYTVLADYKVSNELLTQDIYSVQAAVQRIEKYVHGLEERVEGMGKKGK